MTLTERLTQAERQLTQAESEVARLKAEIEREERERDIMRPIEYNGNNGLHPLLLKAKWFHRETEEGANALARSLELKAKSDLIAERCGARPFVVNEDNWYAFFSHIRNAWDFDRQSLTSDPFRIYFPSKESAERFIELMGNELKEA